MEKTMDLYTAIAKMRELTKKEEEFSIAFMSYDKGRQISRGLIEVPRAKLRASTPEEHNQYSDYMLNYLNVSTNMPGHFWQPCLMFFNEFKIEL